MLHDFDQNFIRILIDTIWELYQILRTFLDLANVTRNWKLCQTLRALLDFKDAQILKI